MNEVLRKTHYTSEGILLLLLVECTSMQLLCIISLLHNLCVIIINCDIDADNKQTIVLVSNI